MLSYRIEHAETIAAVLDRYGRPNHLSHMLRDRNLEAHHEHSKLVDALVSSQSLQGVSIQIDNPIQAP